MTNHSEKMQAGLAQLRRLREAGVYSYGLEVTSGCGPTMVVEGKERINFISNSYLGFSMHPKVIEAAQRAATTYGIGIGGSPIACGTTRLHHQLAERLAANYRTESALVFATGYQALAGSIQGSLDRNDVALVDALAHRSIIDGCQLAGCKLRSFRHNDIDDLKELLASTARSTGRRMVIVDSVYSMDGDVAPLPEILEACRHSGADLLIDEAHSLGVLGRTGKGILEHFGVKEKVALISGTFSKFAGAVGGFAAADRDTIEYLRHFASPFVFSASIPPIIVAAVLKGFDLLEEEPEWLERLRTNVSLICEGLRRLGFDLANTTTPVIPIMIRDTEKTLAFNRAMYEAGVFCSPVVYPGVPHNMERVRLGVMATHNESQLKRALDIFAEKGRQLGLIP